MITSCNNFLFFSLHIDHCILSIAFYFCFYIVRFLKLCNIKFTHSPHFFVFKYASIQPFLPDSFLIIVYIIYVCFLAVVQNKRGLDAPCHKNMFAAVVIFYLLNTIYIMYMYSSISTVLINY